MTRKCLWLIVLVGLLFGCRQMMPSSKLHLAADGRSEYVIIQGAAPTKAEQLAVSELTNYLEKVTGARFTVLSETQKVEVAAGIYVGWTEFARKQGIDPEKLGEEEWIIRSAGPHLILTGGRLRGTLYGIYEFLENQMGCHWLAWDTEVVPRQQNLNLAALDLRGKPAFAPRDLYTTFGNWQAQEKKSKIEQFQLRNRQQFPWNRDIGGPLGVGGSHSFYTYVSPKEWFEKHPEYFSMDAGGKRTCGNIAYIGGSGSELCLSNPDVARITAESISKLIKQKEKEFADRGDPRKFRVCGLGQEDNASFICLCPDCKKISAREGSESGLLIQYANAVSDLLVKEYPDIKLNVMAYVSTDKPPLMVRPRDNVSFLLCDLYGKSDCYRPLTYPVNQGQAELVRGWAQITKELHIWDYWNMGSRLSAPGLPVMIPAETISADMRFFRENHVTGIFVENEAGVTQQSFYDLSVWAGMQLLNKPDLPADKLITTFIDGYYGPAAKPMRAYYDFLATTIKNEPKPMFAPAMNAKLGLSFMNMEFLVRCHELLMNAEAAAAPGSVEQLHVWREMIVVYNCLLHHWDWLKRQAKKDFPFSRPELLDQYEKMRQAMVNHQYSGKRLQDLNSALKKEITVFRSALPLPGQFRGLPAEKVMDFPWPKFAPWTLKDDPEAAGGRAMSYDRLEPEKHKNPPLFGLYDGPSKRSGPTLKITDIPKDEKYHIYKIGRFSLGSGTVIWSHESWEGPGVSLAEAYIWADGYQGADPNLWDVYVSVKITGPAYVPGSTKPNAFWLDRAILVKPETKSE